MDDLRILDTWVAGHGRPAARRLVMLAAAHPDLPDQRLAELPVGYANRLLLRDRQARFGTTVEGEAACPGCQQRLEVSVDLAELLGSDPPAVTDGRETEGEVRVGELMARFRLATAGDLAAVAGCADPAEASR